jgi:hypothetical protein
MPRSGYLSGSGTIREEMPRGIIFQPDHHQHTPLLGGASVLLAKLSDLQGMLR